MSNKTLFWSLFVSFCAFCVSLRLTRAVFSWLLKKAVSMALWVKAGLCGKSSLLEQSVPRTPSQPKTSVNPVILSNFSSCLRALRGENLLCSYNVIARKYLRIDKALYNCRETITDVVSPLQISPFLTNKANFGKAQMNVSSLLTEEYENKTLGGCGKNKPNSKPIKANTKPIKANTNPIRTQYKPNFKLSTRSVSSFCFSFFSAPPIIWLLRGACLGTIRSKSSRSSEVNLVKLRIGRFGKAPKRTIWQISINKDTLEKEVLWHIQIKQRKSPGQRGVSS